MEKDPAAARHSARLCILVNEGCFRGGGGGGGGGGGDSTISFSLW